MTPPPSGEQFEIRSGAHRATVVEVGGGIREYRVGDRDVLDPYPLDALCYGAHGAVLVPWPNRLGDGRYDFEGAHHQVPLNEPERDNAIHGLMRWRPWRAVEHGTDRVVMGARLHPTPGYPFDLDLRVAYTLDEAGLTVAATATNLGDEACPYGFGQHPYLSPGSGRIDECTLHLDAATRITTDDRMLPVGSEPVAGTDFDFRQPRRLGGLAIDSAFTDLARDDEGRAWIRLESPGGEVVALWVDEHHPYIEVYTGDTLGPEHRRRGLGAEPMTCPPDAFRSGTHVIRLEPGSSVTTRWGVGLAEG